MNPVSTHKTMQKANGSPAEYEWYQQLEARYDNLTDDQFEDLISNVQRTFYRVGADAPYASVAISIARDCWKQKEISFNQWKLLSMFVDKNSEKKSKKTFSNIGK